MAGVCVAGTVCCSVGFRLDRGSHDGNGMLISGQMLCTTHAQCTRDCPGCTIMYIGTMYVLQAHAQAASKYGNASVRAHYYIMAHI